MEPGRDVWYDDLTIAQPSSAETYDSDADDPFMLIYTSGTTGRPKGTVHVQGGFPIKATQDMAHCFDVGPVDRLLWFTDIGWMMGPWAICGALTIGATLVLFEGVPDHPGPDRLWSVVERHRVTVLGVAPTVVRALMRHGDGPAHAHDLSSLRVLGASGEPWNVDPWQWFLDHIGGGRCPIINYSGGTEVSGGILAGNMLTPLNPCAFAGPCPGMDADVLDENGNSIRNQVGELVVRSPWPGMTRGFWHDRERYLETYWSRWPNIWVHGDWAEIADDGLWYIRGRSDDTIKLAGKRLGPAEVESALVAHPDVAEAAAIGVPDALKGEALVCFVVLKPGVVDSDELRAALGARVSSDMGRALKPKAVLAITELPKTRNAKVLRRVVRAVYLGEDPGDLSSLDNHGAIEAPPGGPPSFLSGRPAPCGRAEDKAVPLASVDAIGPPHVDRRGRIGGFFPHAASRWPCIRGHHTMVATVRLAGSARLRPRLADSFTARPLTQAELAAPAVVTVHLREASQTDTLCLWRWHANTTPRCRAPVPDAAGLVRDHSARPDDVEAVHSVGGGRSGAMRPSGPRHHDAGTSAVRRALLARAFDVTFMQSCRARRRHGGPGGRTATTTMR